MRGMRFCVMGLASLILAPALGSCGKAAGGEGFQIDSNTNWLKRCELDSECSGALACLCGQCTQPCAEAVECGLLAGASCGSALGGACEASPGAGGLCVLQCTSPGDCEHDDFTCSNGECVPLARTQPELGDGSASQFPELREECPAGDEAMDMDDVFEIIVDDLSAADTDDAVNYRYLTLANRRNAGVCGPDLEVERAALRRMLNSVSLGPTVAVPLAIDAQRLIYRVDLRDYEWDRPVNVNGASYADAWEALAAADPLSAPWVGDSADDVVADTQTAYPVMFASGFIGAATEPSTYYALIDVPEDIDNFMLGNLGIDAADNLARDETIRAGFSGASVGIPEDAFLAERHDIEVRAGYVWQISNFGAPSDLFANPLGAPAGDRELIFTLENMMLGFAFADAGGNRLERSQAFSNGAVLSLRASFGRHAQGVDVTDEVHAAAEGGGLAHLGADVLARVLDIYPAADQLAPVVDDDRDWYARALGSADLDIDATDPISRAYASFVEDVDLNVAAGDLMLTPEQLQRDLRELDPSLQALESGRVSRDQFLRLYGHSLCVMSVALENFPDLAFCDLAAP